MKKVSLLLMLIMCLILGFIGCAEEGNQMISDERIGSESFSASTTTTTYLVEERTLNRNQWKYLNPVRINYSDTIRIVMTGTGDADLYVKKDYEPNSRRYDCRPYLGGSSEECLFNSPGEYYISIHGYSQTSKVSLYFVSGEEMLTAVDPQTNVRWQKGKSPSRLTWENAISYCSNLSLDGYVDWELPSKYQYNLLLNDKPCEEEEVCDSMFPNDVYHYWTSSEHNTDLAYYVTLNDGNVGFAMNKTSTNYARCIRGGMYANNPPANAPQPEDTEDETGNTNIPAENGVFLSLNIDHTYKGDLMVVLISPSGAYHFVHNKQGRGEDDIVIHDLDLTEFFKGKKATGIWKLKISDHASRDTGSLLSWYLVFPESTGMNSRNYNTERVYIPDNDSNGVESSMNVDNVIFPENPFSINNPGSSDDELIFDMGSIFVSDINDDRFKELMRYGDKPIAAFFYASWCGSCAQFKPVFHSVAFDMQNHFSFVEIDVSNTIYDARFNVGRYPTVLIIKPGAETGEEDARFEGYRTEDVFVNELNSYLSNT